MPFVHPVISRKHIIYFLSVIFLLFLCGCKKSDAVVLRVGPVSVTQAEFEEAFKASAFKDDPEGRRAFSGHYVNQKLILLEAERQGLDKDPQFLSEIQKFWQERLLRASMLAKYEEYQPVAQATDEEVNQIYEASKGGTILPEDPQKAKDQIRMMIAQEKQNQLLANWLDSLKQKTPIYLNEQRLGLKK